MIAFSLEKFPRITSFMRSVSKLEHCADVHTVLDKIVAKTRGAAAPSAKL